MLTGWLLRGWWRVALPVALMLTVLTAGAEISVGRFATDSAAIGAPWQVIRLEKHVPATLYRAHRWDGVNAVEANADASMALLGRPIDVDLAATPILCWRWRVEDVVGSANMRKRSGDDYAARIYLAFALPPAVLSFTARAELALVRNLFGAQVPDAALNYVWDNVHPAGTRMPNAYTNRAQMIVQRSTNQDARRWMSERVNVANDVVERFGTREAQLGLIAIATDSDNTGEKIRAGFADLHFVRADEACSFP